MDCRKEKKAALVIERFFVMVKKEVDREIKMAQERKEARRRKKQSHNEEAFLEHVWIDTVDENHVDVFALSQSVSFGSRSNFSLPDAGTPHSRTSIRHQASSPTMNMVMRHDDDTKSLPSSSRSIELSLRSEKRRPKSARAKTGGYFDSFEKRAPSASSHKQSTDSKHKSSVSDTYKELYNLKTAPSHSSTGQHFFGKEPDRSRREQKPPLSTRSDSMHRRSLSSNSEPEAKLAVSGKSPRHGKMLVMNPYPKAQVPSREDLDVNEI